MVSKNEKSVRSTESLLKRHFFANTDGFEASIALLEMIRDNPALVASFAKIVDPSADADDVSRQTGLQAEDIKKLWSELTERRLGYIQQLTKFTQASPENRIEGDNQGIRTVGYMYALEMHRGTRRSGEAAVAHLFAVDEMTRDDLAAGRYGGLRLEAESLASLGHDGWEEFIEGRASDDRPLDQIQDLLSANKIMTPLDVALILNEFGLEEGSDIESSAIEGLISITKTRDHISGDIIDEKFYLDLIASHHNPAVIVRKSKDLAHNLFTHELGVAENEKFPRYFSLVASSHSNPARFWAAYETFAAELKALRRYVEWANRQDVKAFLNEAKIPTPEVNDRISLLEAKLAT